MTNYIGSNVSRPVLPGGQALDLNALAQKAQGLLGQVTQTGGTSGTSGTTRTNIPDIIPSTSTSWTGTSLVDKAKGLLGSLLGTGGSTSSTTTSASGGTCGNPGDTVRIAQKMFLRPTATIAPSGPEIAAGSTITLRRFVQTSTNARGVVSELWEVDAPGSRHGFGLLARGIDCTRTGTAATPAPAPAAATPAAPRPATPTTPVTQITPAPAAPAAPVQGNAAPGGGTTEFPLIPVVAAIGGVAVLTVGAILVIRSRKTGAQMQQGYAQYGYPPPPYPPQGGAPQPVYARQNPRKLGRGRR
jgi:hypothetical protein